MPIHRPQVAEAHILKHAARQHTLFQRLFDPVDHPVDHPPRPGGVHNPPVVLFKGEVLGLHPLLGQMVGHPAHVGGDGHAVVVEDDQQLPAAVPGVGQPLIGQSAGEGSVPYQGNHSVAFPQHGPCPRHSQGHRHRVGGVAGDKGVVDALRRLGESGDAAVLPQGGHGLPPAGEHLVGVALMAHVKDQPVH